MKTLPLLLVLALLVACGDTTSDDPTPTSPDASGDLPARAEPLAVGDEAPAFSGLPEAGKTVLVFYRGPW